MHQQCLICYLIPGRGRIHKNDRDFYPGFHLNSPGGEAVGSRQSLKKNRNNPLHDGRVEESWFSLVKPGRMTAKKKKIVFFT